MTSRMPLPSLTPLPVTSLTRYSRPLRPRSERGLRARRAGGSGRRDERRHCADDDELDPVQQAIAAIEASEDYTPVEPEGAAEATSDGTADDDTYDPVLDTLARKVGDPSQDTDGAAVSVGPSEELDLPAGASTSGDDDAPVAAASRQEEPAAADADAVPVPDTGARPPKQMLPRHRQPPRPL